jgi:hypothetical protein
MCLYEQQILQGLDEDTLSKGVAAEMRQGKERYEEGECSARAPSPADTRRPFGGVSDAMSQMFHAHDRTGTDVIPAWIACACESGKAYV